MPVPRPRLELKGELRGDHLLPAARAAFLRRLEQWESVGGAYRQALCLVSNEAERRFLARRLAEVESKMQ
jgi:RNA polymerase sigma-70 factor (ECF subfamily)